MRQRGLVLLATLVALLLLGLAALMLLRGILGDAVSTGAVNQHLKLVAQSDQATQQLIQDIAAATAQGQPLEVSAQGQSWFVASAAPPTAASWARCTAGGSGCAALNSLGAGVSAWGVVRTTGQVDPYGCGSPQYAAVQYAIDVLVRDPKGVGAATETLYKVCFPADFTQG